jgi:hypothetical protein
VASDDDHAPEPTTRPPTVDDDHEDPLRRAAAEPDDTPDGVVLDDMVAGAPDASVDERTARRAGPKRGTKKHRDRTARGRSQVSDVAAPVAGTDPEAVTWARSFLDAREAESVVVSREDLLRAAGEAGIDAPRVRQALTSLGVPLRRNRVGWPTRTAPPGEGGESLRAGDSRAARPSKRAPEGKVRIVAVDLDTDGQPVDPLQPMSIVVRISCDEPGRLEARVLVRGAGHGEVEAVAPVRDVTEPGELALCVAIPADALGELKHSIDVEAWLRTATETYASMHASAQRFRSRERRGPRPFLRLDATWSTEAL